jgi:hypothetical protein
MIDSMAGEFLFRHPGKPIPEYPDGETPEGYAPESGKGLNMPPDIVMIHFDVIGG